MKHYALYCTNTSNHNRLITEDADGNQFTEQSARDYANGITNSSVYIVHMSKPLELVHI